MKYSVAHYEIVVHFCMVNLGYKTSGQHRYLVLRLAHMIDYLFLIGHSLWCMETWFGPSTQGTGIRYQNTSHIQILLAGHFDK